MARIKTGEKYITSIPVTVKGIDKENRTLTMVASSQDVDRHGDTILQDGWDLGPYKKNPVILNSHRYDDATEVIARAKSTKIEGKGKKSKLVQVWEFAVEENPKAEIIFNLYAGGYLHASSVGFIPRKFKQNKDGSTDYFTIEEAELLEVSAVSVPANAAATLAKSIGTAEEDETPEDDNTEETEEEIEPDPEEQAPEIPVEPEKTAKPKLTKRQKYARAIHKLNAKQKRDLQIARDTIDEMLNGKRERTVRRDYNTIIRRLLKSK